MLMLAAAFQRRDTGAAEFEDLVTGEHLQKGVDLFRLAGQLKDHAVGRKVDDFGFVDARNLAQFGALAGIAGHFEQQQLALQAVFGDELKHLAGYFEPLGLQDQLVDVAVVAVGCHSDPADGRVVGGRDGQAVNVEAAAVEQT